MTQRLQSEAADISRLAEPLHFHFSNRSAPNRFMKAAMAERLASWDPVNLEARGIPSSNLVNVYRRWGEGGFGLILTGNVMLDYDQLVEPGDAVIPHGAPLSGPRFDAFRDMASAGKAHGSLMVAQVSHPGRQTPETVNDKPISASDVQLEGDIFGMRFAKPRGATKGEIKEIVNWFTHAAVFLHEAGFDGIQLHGAHGYLLAQFLSQTTNHRTDEYGGSLTNRARIITEIADSIRQAVPASTGFILGVKINSVEFQKSGFSPSEAKELVSLLESHRFDFVELSGGTYESLAFDHKRASTRARECFFIEFADQIVPALTHTRSYVTGGLRTAGAMAHALTTVDGVGLARPAAAEFHLPLDILRGKLTGALEPRLDPADFGLHTIASSAQIRQVGLDQQPIDLSRRENVDVFLRDMAVWAQWRAEDTSGTFYGSVDLASYQAKPFGTVEG